MAKKQVEPPFELSADQKQVLQSLARGETDFAPRASTLLALAGGQDLESAAATGGLTPNQARYWQGRFRSQGLAAFPADLVTQHSAVPSLPRQQSLDLLEAPPASLLLEGPAAAEALLAAKAEAAETKSSGKKQSDKDKQSTKKKSSAKKKDEKGSKVSKNKKDKKSDKKKSSDKGKKGKDKKGKKKS